MQSLIRYTSKNGWCSGPTDAVKCRVRFLRDLRKNLEYFINEEVVQIDNQKLPITEHLSNICLTKHIEGNNQDSRRCCP